MESCNTMGASEQRARSFSANGGLNFLDKLSMVIVAQEQKVLRRNSNESVTTVMRWMAENRLGLAPEKRQSVLLPIGTEARFGWRRIS